MTCQSSESTQTIESNTGASDASRAVESDESRIAKAMKDLKNTGWYWGSLTANEAKEILQNSSEGTFLVRDSSQQDYLFTISAMTSAGPTNLLLCVRVSVTLPAPSGGCLFSACSPCLFLNGWLMSGHFVEMEPEHRALLRAHRLELSGQLLVSDTIVPFLYQEDILSQTQVEDIECQPTNGHKALKLLDILPNRGPRAFHLFLRSLDDFSWIRDQLLLELQTEPGRKDTWRLLDSVPQRVPTDRELSRLASRLGADWESVLMDLGLSAEALFRCRSDHSLSTHGAVLSGLVQWRQGEGKRATVQRLVQSLKNADVHPSVLEDVLMSGTKMPPGSE